MENYTKEFKMQVVSEYNQCKDIEFVLSKYGIAKSTLFYWIGRYKMLTDKTQYTIGDYIRLQNKYDKKLREFEIMEKAHCFKDSPRQQKLEAIESLFGQYPTKEMCRVLALPTGTFYNYRKSRLVETQYEKRDNFLKEQIKRVFDESEGRFSGNKICKKLKSEGIKVSELKVYELMKVLNIKPKLRKKRTFIQQEGKFKYLKNKLNREFNPHAPNVSWVSDTTKLCRQSLIHSVRNFGSIF